MNESHDHEIIGGHLLVIGGAEDKYNERRILKKFLELAGGDPSLRAELLLDLSRELVRLEPLTVLHGHPLLGRD